MQIFTLQFFVAVFLINLLSFTGLAEGTKQTQPTATDFGLLQIDKNWSPFATYGAPEEDRLHIRICNLGERIYYGFNEPFGGLQYRIIAPDGSIAVGPANLPNAGAGFINTHAEAIAGPNQVIGAGGYTALQYIPTMTGDYYLEFSYPGRRKFNYWDITVADINKNEIPGRVWSKAWQFTTEGYNNPFQAKLYVYADDSIVTSIDFNGMSPFVFVISCNQSGVQNTGNAVADRKSTFGNVLYKQYKIFLNDPDPSCFPTGKFGSFTSPTTITGCASDSFCINLNLDKQGQADVLLNLNGVAGYQENSKDVLISTNIEVGGNCVFWNGKDGQGNTVPFGTAVDVDVNYFNGLTHLPLFDVENHPKGYIVEAVRPPATKPALYWDDSQVAGGTVELIGCTDATGCHKWPYSFYGDVTTVNTWWYGATITDQANLTVEYVRTDANIANPPGEANDTTICGTDTTIQLNGGVDHATGGVWSGGAGVFSPDKNTLNASYTFTNTELASNGISLKLTSTGNMGCSSDDDPLSISIIPPPLANAGPDQEVCANNPVIQLNASMQNASSGQWSGGSGTFDPNPSVLNAKYYPSSGELSAGSLTLIFTAFGNGVCGIYQDQMVIDFVSPPVVNISSTNATCNGKSDGVATANINNGNPPYTYQWNTVPIQTTAGITNLQAGAYTVTVTDGNSCNTSTSVVIGEPATLSLSTSQANVTCKGKSDAMAAVSVAGGTAPFSYQWNTNPVQTASTATGLSAGNYTITVSDLKSCSTSATVTITEPGELDASVTINPVSCKGKSDGSLSASPYGGTPPYFYQWNDPAAQTTAIATGLIAGTYHVTIQDSKGCLKNVFGNVTEPDSLKVNITGSKNISCKHGIDGTATAQATGGTAPYNYQWTTTPSQFQMTATGLNAGNYKVIAIDNNSCVDTAEVTLNEPDSLIAQTSVTDANCGNSDGAAIVSGTGGTSPYTFQWEVGTAGNSITNVPAGVYKVFITDNNGCKDSTYALINNKEVFFLASTSTDVTCPEGSDGTGTAVPSGGTAPYTYQWTPVGGNDSIAENLKAGTYYVTATDNVGCLATQAITINEPNALIGGTSQIDITCYGGNDGKVIVKPAGGTAPYTYAWISADSNDSIAENLPAGSHQVIVTDAMGCDTTLTTTLIQPDSITITVDSLFDATCKDRADGRIYVSATGGTMPYSFTWNNGQTGKTAFGLKTGIYIITVTDSKGCRNQKQITINEPDELTAIINSKSNALCKNNSDGNATVLATGGSQPYSYSWNTIPEQTTSQAINLKAGNYIVTVRDKNFCQTNVNTTINEPDLLIPSLASVSHISCNSKLDGSAEVQVTGGTSPYQYQWNTSPVQTTSKATGIGAGIYTIQITDSNQCDTSLTITINEPTKLSALIQQKADVSCYGGSDGKAMVKANGGTLPYSYLWSVSPVQTTAGIQGLKAGKYSVVVKDKNKCGVTISVDINQPDSLELSINTQNITCNGDNDGMASGLVKGGTQPYSYRWNSTPVQNTQSANNLAPDTYTLEVTDTNGCTIAAKATINQPAPLQGDSTFLKTISCKGLTDGTASVFASGGTPPYKYLWSHDNAMNVSKVENLSPGNYTVLITDDNLCMDSVSIRMTEPDILGDTSVTEKNVSCKGFEDGIGIVLIDGGTKPYRYKWTTNPPQTAAIATGLEPGSYSVTVTDTNGCDTTITISISEPDSMKGKLALLDHVQCYEGNDGQASIIATGGNSPYTYFWDFIEPDTLLDSTSVVSGLIAGDYEVVIVDDQNCYDTVAFTITQPQTLITAIADPSDICLGDSTTITANAEGGAGNYTYSWDQGLGSDKIGVVSPATTTTYTLTVTDSCGTETKDSIVVVVHPVPQVDFEVLKKEGCAPFHVQFNDSSVAADGSVYLWDFGDGTTSNQKEPKHLYPQTDTFNVKLKIISPIGCTDSTEKNVDIIVHPTPKADFDLNPEVTTIVTPTAELTNNSTDALNWLWTFGDGTLNDSIWSPKHTFQDNGTYEITLLVMGDYICMDSLTKKIIIKPDFGFFIPNAFTPNYDHNNEGFIGQGIGIETHEMWIYNRWGEMIYHTDNISGPIIPWNGMLNNGTKAAERETYVYIVHVVDIFGIAHEYIGHVTLVR